MRLHPWASDSRQASGNRGSSCSREAALGRAAPLRVGRGRGSQPQEAQRAWCAWQASQWEHFVEASPILLLGLFSAASAGLRPSCPGGMWRGGVPGSDSSGGLLSAPTSLSLTRVLPPPLPPGAGAPPWPLHWTLVCSWQGLCWGHGCRRAPDPMAPPSLGWGSDLPCEPEPMAMSVPAPCTMQLAEPPQPPLPLCDPRARRPSFLHTSPPPGEQEEGGLWLGRSGRTAWKGCLG